MKLAASLFFLMPALWYTVTAQECLPCSDGVEPFILGAICENAVELMQTLTSDQDECKVLQLTMYQLDCCDSAPVDFCTLCESGDQSFNAEKAIPRNANGPPFESTCEEYATLDIYVYEGDTGICADTERVRARAWCECDGVEPACSLTCNDGNPPPDLNKTDPIFGESCARFAYEYTTLSKEECLVPDVSLNFNAKAFCCNEPEPDDCSICPVGQMLGDSTKEVRTEFFGTTTCGKINTYARYLPTGSCKDFIDELLDNPFGAEGECCVDDPNAAVAGGSSAVSIFQHTVPSFTFIFLTVTFVL